jgi:hypothetical protein
MKAGHDALVLDVGQTAEADDKLGAAAPRPDQVASLFDLAVPQAEVFTNPFEAESSVHGSLYLRSRAMCRLYSLIYWLPGIRSDFRTDGSSVF